MLKLFRRLILRPLRRDPARTGLTVLSIALGVAVVIAIELAGDAAAGSFQSSLTSLVGKVDYEITVNGGVDETYIAKLTALGINARFAPVIEQPATIEGGGSTTLYGIDVIGSPERSSGLGTDPGQLETWAAVSSDTAARFHWEKGSRIGLRGPALTKFFIVGAIAASQNSG